MAALQVKQICMYLELADLPKIINTKLDQGEDRGFSQVLIYIQKYNFLRNIMMEIAVTALSLCQAKTMTQIRTGYQNKGKKKAQSQRQ